MYLRKCLIDDCDTLYKWSNDPTVRINAFNTSPIPYEEHLEWFEKSLKNEKRKIFICIDNDIKVGQIRIDIENNIATISYTVDKDARGKGIGTEMLKLLYKNIKFNDIQIEKLKGIVKKENIASKKAFLNNDYKQIEDEEYMIYVKEIN